MEENNRKATFVRETDRQVVNTMKENFNAEKYFAWDQLVMSVAIDENVMLESKEAFCSVVLTDDEGKRGQMTVDWEGKANGKVNVTILTKVDHELYKKHYMKCVKVH